MSRSYFASPFTYCIDWLSTTITIPEMTSLQRGMLVWRFLVFPLLSGPVFGVPSACLFGAIAGSAVIRPQMTVYGKAIISWLSLQRQREKKAKMSLGILYEGMPQGTKLHTIPISNSAHHLPMVPSWELN